jgi:3-isopropylmalate dehydratase small subunit
MKGKAWKYGDNVDTDVIVPARYLTATAPEALKAHCLEGLDPAFAAGVSPGDFIVAGNNFGCGSSREHAPLSIQAAGVGAVIARSFARIFFRNSFNIGLPILESPAAVDNIEAGDELEVDLAAGTIKDLTRGKEFLAQPAPDFMRELIADGGLLAHLKKRIERGEVLPRPAAPAEEIAAEPEVRERGARMKEIESEKESAGRAAPWVEDEADGKPQAAPTLDEGEEEEEGNEG